MYISCIPDLNHHMWTNHNKSAADSTSEAAKLRSAWGRNNDWFVQITYDILFQTSVLLVVWWGTQRPVKSVSVATCPHSIHSHWNPSSWSFRANCLHLLWVNKAFSCPDELNQHDACNNCQICPASFFFMGYQSSVHCSSCSYCPAPAVKGFWLSRGDQFSLEEEMLTSPCAYTDGGYACKEWRQKAARANIYIPEMLFIVNPSQTDGSFIGFGFWLLCLRCFLKRKPRLHCQLVVQQF